MKGLFKLKNNEKGQSMVEFALVLPILLTVVMMIFQLSIYYSAKTELTNHAREYVRLAALDNKSDEVIRDELKQEILNHPYLSRNSENIDFNEAIQIIRSDDSTYPNVKILLKLENFELDLIFKKYYPSISGSATMMIEPKSNAGGGSSDGCSTGHSSLDSNIIGKKLVATEKDQEISRLKNYINDVNQYLNNINSETAYVNGIRDKIIIVKQSIANLKATDPQFDITKLGFGNILDKYETALKIYDSFMCN